LTAAAVVGPHLPAYDKLPGLVVSGPNEPIDFSDSDEGEFLADVVGVERRLTVKPGPPPTWLSRMTSRRGR
jgi:hypothetical protein